MALKKNQEKAMADFLQRRPSPITEEISEHFLGKNENNLNPEPPNFLEASLVAAESIVADVPHSTLPVTTEQKKPGEKHDLNQTQTTHKVDINLTQELNTNSTQSEHAEITNNTYQTQSKHKLHTKLNTWKTQSKHKLHTNQTQTIHISTLIGVQRMILLFIFEECKKARSHITEPLSIIYIISSLEIPPGSVKTSIARLCEKEFLRVNSFKNGRGGWSVYEVPDKVYKELLQMETQHKLHTNQTQSRYKVDTKLNTQLNTSAPSSSSSLNIKETTTTELGDEWNFDITPYGKFGFTVSQVKQLASLRVISAADVAQSLIEFSYDLENNFLPPIKTNKINFLMGLLRAGHSYVSEGFKNEQETIISEMASRTESRREKLLKDKFVVWEAALSDEERQRVLAKLPTPLMVLEKTYGIGNEEIRKWYFDYFIQNSKG